MGRVADGGQRVVRRLTEKEEREKRKADERAAKEEVKLKEKEDKEKARAEARRAARFPIDDLEVTEAFDEEVCNWASTDMYQ